MKITTPVSPETINTLKINDQITISGKIFAGRDAALPKLVALVKNQQLLQHNITLEGGAIFHTAVSDAGIGPTSSNKLEIEESIPLLSESGIKIHIGKGKLAEATIEALKQQGAIFVVTPPVSALLSAKVSSRCLVAFAEEGIEALYELTVHDFPAIVAIAHGESIFDKKKES